MKMAELERRSGVNRETIRYYIREGLLPAPERKKPNVAAYSEVHVGRLKAIRRLQEERFLPLDVIRRVLNGDLTGLPTGVTSFPELGPLLEQRLGLTRDDRTIALATLARKMPSARKDAETFERLGVIQLHRRGNKIYLEPIDARIVALWGTLRAAGFTEAFGFSPKDTDVYVDAVSRVAAVEVERFISRMGTSFPQERAVDIAQTGIEVVNTLLGVLRIKAILKELARRTGATALFSLPD